uniref:Uncharacterized protein n=1 Tax=Arundo donax TaxID=35708 RepID=A0A0A9BP36_ARUDO
MLYYLIVRSNSIGA